MTPYSPQTWKSVTGIMTVRARLKAWSWPITRLCDIEGRVSGRGRSPLLRPTCLVSGRDHRAREAARPHAARRGPLLVDRPTTGLHQEASTRSGGVPCPVESVSPRRLPDRPSAPPLFTQTGPCREVHRQAVIRPVAAAIGDAENGSYSLRGAAASSPGALARPPRTAPPG